MNPLNKEQIEILIKITIDAGKIAMSHFGRKTLRVTTKPDDSPVTNADIEISKFIDEKLKKHFAGIDIICEEGKHDQPKTKLFWIIDPIDGTRNYTKSEQEFTINIGLIKNSKPVFGIIYVPALKDAPLYFVNHKNQAVRFLVKKNSRKILTKKAKVKKELRIISGNAPENEQIQNYIAKNINPKRKVKITKVSSSLKFCYIVDDKADLYLHFKKSMEWDTGAGQALVLAWGGKVKNFEEKGSLKYRKPDLVNPKFLVY